MSDLVNGVVVSSNNYSSNMTYWIQTSKGPAVCFPRVHINDPEIKLGTYVSVRTLPPAREERGKNDEVESITIITKPRDHQVKIVSRMEIQISCEATLINSINRDCFFENSYLGRMILRNMNRRVEGMQKGTICRIVCRRTNPHERVLYESMGVHWIVELIDFSQIRPPSSNIERSISNSNDSPASSLSEEWAKVIVTGCNRGIWEATGSVVDKVLIPMGDEHSIEKGSIYRVKYFTDSDGTNTAYEMDSVPFPNTDVQLLKDHFVNINIWCTSRIVFRGEKYWTVRNEILGEAKFPLTRVASNMKIGDEVRTLYEKVLMKGDDGILWNVSDVDTEGGKGRMMQTFSGFSNVSSNILTSINNTSFNSSRRIVQNNLPGTDKKMANTRDRTCLDWMRQTMKSPNVRRSFERYNKSALDRIQSILARDQNNNTH